MKRLIALVLLCALFGCTHSSRPPAFGGQGIPVNTPQIMTELNSHD